MNKKVKITSLATAALATVVLASANLNDEVKADSQVSGTTAKANSAVDNAKANVDSAQKAVNDAQVKVNDAKSSLDSANSNASAPDNAYSTQADVVAKDRVDVKTKSDAVDNATKEQEKRQDLVNEAKKPNAIDNAKKAVSDKNDDIAKKQDAVKTAQSKTPAAEKAVNDAKSNLTDKQNVLNDKKTAKSDADKAVKNAQDALNGTGINEAQDAVNKANKAVDQDNKDKKQIDTDVENATKTKNDIDKAKQVADKAKTEATAKQNDAQKAYDTAKKSSDEAKTKVDSKNVDISNLKDQLLNLKNISINTIDLGDVNKFKKAYMDYALKGKLTQDDIDYVNSARSKNNYISSEDNETINYNDMSKNQIQDISLFATNVLNKVRSQLGLKVSDDEVNPAMVDFAQKIAKRYNTDLAKRSWVPGWHDATGINDESKNSGLESNERPDRSVWQRYEDLSTTNYGYEANPTGTMNELKSRVYNAILTMLLPDGNGYDDPNSDKSYEMGHAGGLLGITVNKNSIEYLNKAKNMYESAKKDIENEPGTQTTISNDGKEEVYNLHNIDVLNTKIEKLTQDLNDINNGKLTDDFIESKQYLSAITTFYYDPVSQMDVFQIHFLNVSPNNVKDATKFGDTKAIPSYDDQIKDLQKSISNENNVLVQLTNDYNKKQATTNTAQINLTNAQNDLKSKTEAAEIAQENYDSAVKKLSEVTTKQTQINQKLTADQKIQNSAQARLAALTASNEEKAKNLQTATATQAKAEEAVKTAQEAVNQAQSKLENAQKVQSDLNKDIAAKQEAVKKAQDELKTLEQHVSDLENAPANLDKANKELATAKDNLKTAQDALTKDEAKLKDLQAAKDSADNAVATAQANYDQAQNELKTAQDKLTQAQNELKTIQDKEASKSNIKTNTTTKKSTKNEAKSTAKQTLSQKARVYDKNGKAIKKNGKFVTYKKGAKINGKLVTIKGKKYYQIGKNEFIKAGNVKVNKTTKKSVAKSIKLTHTAFVYDKNGKIVRKGLKINYIKRGKTVKALKTVTIKGKKYYQVGKNEFIKAANAKFTTQVIHLTATIKAKKNSKVKTYARSGKLNKHYVLGKKSYKFNEKLTINGKTYYKIAGKNDWVPASKLNLKK
ncbi:SEC10/PgrA surface exclusion domain-containing protein [Lactobacillus sp. LL6]|uniref:SEC10/PgrA surface exclusion domain-containing protein n=1 Tax=Lactobacillus sp. LL6 TaxID=2596827 RepID=UPI00118657EF|nr:SEC10/PgrA surface exclusion domain-containing protein [Lactobacillus sp. LL6]TSO26136.1 SEC10/PgrA surface exclusion domain-containing protein [Lactobacillus sp. LL6]